MVKLLLITMLAGALAKGLAPSEPPLLIDTQPPPAALDASR